MPRRGLDDIEVSGRRVFLRADLNVPVRGGAVTDATRIDRLAPTIRELADAGATVIVASHFGRPGGRPDPAMSLGPLAAPLSAALGGRPVAFVAASAGPEAERAAAAAAPGEVLLLENLRFHPGEEANDPDFAGELASLAEIYVNDAFSASHRAHASVAALARLLPAAAGRLMEAEIGALETALGSPARPAGAIVGGAKISTKLDLLGNLTERFDMLAIGGAMANTFLHALGTDVGASFCERDMADTARSVLARADASACEIVLPSDAVVAPELADGVPADVVPVGGVPSGMMILDVGPGSANGLAVRLGALKTLIWNGPLGAFETPPFDAATMQVARIAADLTRSGRLHSVAGGGDTVAALSAAGVVDEFSYVSTAGGAFLEWLEGKTLPGVAALE